MVSKKYELQLTQLAEQLVTPERYGSVAVAPEVELQLVLPLDEVA